MDKKEKIFAAIVLVAIVIIILIAYLFMQGTKTENELTSDYITKYVWDESKIQAFYNTYYVDRGYAEKPIAQSYILLKVETEKGDLQEGTYKAEAKNVINIYITDKPIDLNTTEEIPIVVVNETKEISVKKGQYLYMVRGYDNQGSMNLTKK